MQEPNRLERVSDFQLLKHKVYEVIKKSIINPFIHRVQYKLACFASLLASSEGGTRKQ
jgi:hypothetical protein